MERYKLIVSLVILLVAVTQWTEAQGRQNIYVSSAENWNEQAVKVVEKGTSLEHVLSMIEGEYNVNFLFDSRLLDDKTLSSQLILNSEEELYDLLDDILAEFNVTYKKLTHRTLGIVAKPEQSVQKQRLETVSGIVTDAKTGETLPGVNILVKGTATGTSTDSGGRFELDVPSLQDTLVVSFIGYQTKAVPINGQSEISIQLMMQAISGEEMVVVGYGTQEKRHLTGSIGSVELDESTASTPMVDLGEALYGKIAGVQVSSASGRPGQPTGIQIRGVNSLSAGSAPLIVIDGVVMPGFNLNALNTSDIQSIDILKDASAAAIYGSRGSNGVIQVTTKSSQANKPKISFNYSYTSQSAMDRVDVMNASEYAQAAIDAAQNGWIDSGGDPNAPNTIEARGERKYTWPEALEHPETLWDTDFQDVVLSVAPMHKGGMGYEGGTKNSYYRVSGGFIEQDGIVHKSDFQQFSMNVKAGTNSDNWLDVGGMLNMVYNDETIPHPNTVFNAVQYPSIYPVYGNNDYLGGPNSVDGFGEYYGILFRAFNGHPYHWNSRDIEGQAINSTGNFWAELEILPELSFRSTVSAFYNRNDFKTYTPTDTGIATPRTAITNVSMNRIWNYSMSNILRYSSDWEDHQVNAIAGYEYNKREFYSVRVTGCCSNNDLIPYLNGSRFITRGSNGANESALISILSRINYNYKGKYLASIAYRRDGSSRFGPENKWGDFPSFSAGWRISEEGFMDGVSFLNSLTLRASYGLTGNDNIGNYSWISSMRRGRAAFGNNVNTTFYASTVENPNLRWERTKQLNLGFDMGLFEDRVQIEADFYEAESDGLLLHVPVPKTSGFSSVFKNIGALENKGIELGISSHNITMSDFSWTSNVTFSKNRSMISQMGPDGAPVILRRQFMDIINQVGEKPFSFYGYKYDGVYMNQAEIDADPVEYPFTVHPGDGKYVDVNEDGKIDGADRTVIGNPEPDFTWSLTNNFNYKNFDFSFLIQGSVGGDLYFADNHRSLFWHEGRNYLAEMKNRWRSEENPGDGYHYKLSVDTDGLEREPSSYWIDDRSFTRLRNVTLGTVCQKVT